MKLSILASAMIFLGSTVTAQETSSITAKIDLNSLSSGLNAEESQLVRNALRDINSGAVNTPKKLFIVEGGTVWARDVAPSKGAASIVDKIYEVEIDGGVKFTGNNVVRIGDKQFRVKSLKIGSGKIGFVLAGAAGAGALLCSYMDQCNEESNAQGVLGDMEIIPIEPATD